MLLAEVTPTIVHVDSGGLIWALGALGSSIGGGIAGAVKIWISYRTVRDEKDRAMREAHLTREEKLADRADSRDQLWRTEGNKTIDKLLEIAQSNAKLSQTVASALEQTTRTVEDFSSKLDRLIEERSKDE